MLCVDCAPGASGHRPASVRRNGPAGCLVDSAARRLPRPLHVRRLRDVGGLPGRSLHLRTVSLAVLFSRALRQLASQLVRPEAGGLAGVAAVLAGAADPADSRAVPLHVLLLSRRVLQSVLERSAVLHRRRAAEELLGRELVSARPAERSPLHAVHLGVRADDPRVRRVEGDVVRRSRRPDDVTFGIGVGTLVLIANVVLLGGYLFGCHSMRHVVGGCVDQLSRAPLGLPPTTASAASTAGTWSGPGPACSASASPISTSGCARWACGRTSGSFDAGVSDTRT